MALKSSFDGRGGTTSVEVVKHISFTLRYPTIENKEIQITVQGQTISSNFEPKFCRYN
jgi:hypothetical protein